MASILKVDEMQSVTTNGDITFSPDGTGALSFKTNDTERMEITSSGVGNAEFIPRAWIVCGDTTGTNETTIEDSYNFSSVTDAEVGANYYNYAITQPAGARAIVASQDNSGWNAGRIMVTGATSTTQCRCRTWATGGSNADTEDDARHHVIVCGPKG